MGFFTETTSFLRNPGVRRSPSCTGPHFVGLFEMKNLEYSQRNVTKQKYFFHRILNMLRPIDLGTYKTGSGYVLNFFPDFSNSVFVDFRTSPCFV